MGGATAPGDHLVRHGEGSCRTARARNTRLRILFISRCALVAMSAPSFARSCCSAIRDAIRNANRLRHGDAFRIVHFSVQQNHVHLIVEANDKPALRRGAAGLAVRAARAINRAMGRRGAVWSERYHVRAMKTPRQVRNTLVYVLFNFKKHHPETGRAGGTDPCSSAQWFDGFLDDHARYGPPARDGEGKCGPPCEGREGDPVVARASTWLLSVGWRRRGLIKSLEAPTG